MEEVFERTWYRVKIYTSYFYQLRFFPKHYIPISTAIFDPKWFHDNKGPNYVFKDKRGVYNGIRCNPLHPGPLCTGLCNGTRGCLSLPGDCLFLQAYRVQLNAINFPQFMQGLEALVNRVCEKENFTEELVVVFLVYETPDNPCSERQPLLDWFQSHGIDAKELTYPLA
ncbi:MAG: hypothetical protein NC218_09505 [Acetobacter sp.]|nr:hypothetical protein [Acetobacter sp.]